jgi:hypothetical protein
VTTYMIRRLYVDDDRPVETIKTGLSLDEAREHCKRDDTRGGSLEDGSAWFDGYEEES